MMHPRDWGIRCSQLAPAVATIPAICAAVQITRHAAPAPAPKYAPSS